MMNKHCRTLVGAGIAVLQAIHVCAEDSAQQHIAQDHTAQDDTAQDDTAQGERKQLQQQIDGLHARLSAAEHAFAAGWPDTLALWALVEVQAHYSDSAGRAGDQSASDIVLATAALGAAARVNPRVGTTVALLYEEDATELDVDVATVDLTVRPNLALTLGQSYLPFGVYESALVNDTLALALGETRESTVLLGYSTDPWRLDAYLFNGDLDTGAGRLDKVGARLAYAGEQFSAGIDYLSSILHSDGLQAWAEGALEATPLTDPVQALAGHARWAWGPVCFVGEYLQSSKISSQEQPAMTEGAQPKALQLEVDVELDGIILAAAWQMTDELQFLGLPEQRLSLGLRTELFPRTQLAAELWRDRDYGSGDGGTAQAAYSVAVQLAVAF